MICPKCGSFDAVCLNSKRQPMVGYHPERIRRAQEASASALLGRLTHRYQISQIYIEHDRCEECGAEAREPCCDMDDTPTPLPCEGRKLLPVGMIMERAE